MGGPQGALHVVILIVLAYGLASVEADIDVRVAFIEMAFDAYPAAPPSTFTGAVIVLENNGAVPQDIYIVPGTCTMVPQNESISCDIWEIFEHCCPLSVCNGSATRPPDMPDCVCASRADRVCVDPETPYTFAGDAYLTAPPWFEAYPFEIPLKPLNATKKCTNHIIIDTGSLIGDHDIYLVSMTQSLMEDFVAAETGAFTYGKDSFAVCAGDNEDDSNCIARWYTNTVVGEVAPRITGLLIGYGRFDLTVSLSNELGLVPYADAAHHKLASPYINCSGNIVGVYSTSPPYLPVMLPPTEEPALDALHGVACYKNLYDNAKTFRNKIALLVGIAEDGITILTPNIADLSTCSLHANLYQQTGAPILLADTPNYLSRTILPSECNVTRLNKIRETLAPPTTTYCDESNYTDLRCKLELDETNLALKSISRVASASGIQATVAWAACRALADTFLANETQPKELTKQCWAEPGSTEYATNACCNVDLTWNGCCNETLREPLSWKANEYLVSDTCDDPACASNLASALASFEAIPQQCRQEALNATLRVYDPFSNGNSARPLGPCYQVSISGNDTEFVECANRELDDAYKAEFISLWRAQNTSVSISISNWLATAWQIYTLTSGCLQPGFPPFDMSASIIRNLTLDKDPALCLSTSSCNWGAPGLSYNQCVESYRPLGMCANCTEGYCVDYTVATACYIPWAAQLQCIASNGTADPELICLLPYTDAASCLPSEYCDVSEPECLPFCYMSKVLIEADCNCSTCEWDAAKNFCVRNDTQGQTECEAVNGAYWLGRVWQAPVRATESTCTGYCDDYPVATTEAECNFTRPGSCSNFGRNETTCESEPGCNDSVFYNGGNPACLRDFSLFGSTYAGCGAQSQLVSSAGCVWLDEDRAAYTAVDVCDAYGGRLVEPATNESTCNSTGRCQEPNFAPGVTTPKSETECAACGGTWVQAFKWGDGTWTNAPNISHWHPLQWVNRTYAQRFKVASFFNREQFLMDFYKVLAGQQARAVETAIACKGAGLFDLVSAMACRCAEINSGECAPVTAYFVLGRTRVCLSTLKTFTFLEGESITIEPNSWFSPLCADLSVEQVDQALLQRRDNVESSSILLQVLAPGRFAVVPNSRGVIVASLVGPGRRIVLDNAMDVSGNYTLCTSVNESLAGKDKFTKRAFATYDVSTKKWTLLEDAVVTVHPNIYCGRVSMSSSVIVFPVRCANDPESQLFRDQLGPASVKRTLLASIIIYLCLSLMVLARFLLAIRAAIEDRKEKVGPILFCVLFGAVYCATTIRWIYALMFYLGRVIHTSAGPLLLLVDLPFFVFATAFSILISRWATFYADYMKNKGPIKKTVISIAAISVNVLLYGLFISVLFAFGAISVPSNNGESFCTTTYNSKDARSLRLLGKAYRTIEAIVSVLLAAGFLVYSSIFYYPYLRGGSRPGGSNFRTLINVSAVAVLCAFSLLLQATLFLYVTYKSGANGTAVLICLLLVESIPVLSLLFLWGNKSIVPCWCAMPPEDSTEPYCTSSLETEGPPESFRQ